MTKAQVISAQGQRKHLRQNSNGWTFVPSRPSLILCYDRHRWTPAPQEGRVAVLNNRHSNHFYGFDFGHLALHGFFYACFEGHGRHGAVPTVAGKF